MNTSTNPDEPKSEQCGNCRFYNLDSETTKSFHGSRRTESVCRRYPPIVSDPSCLVPRTFFPTVYSISWCGEWKFNPAKSKEGSTNEQH